MTETNKVRRRKGKKPPVEVELQLGEWGPRGSVSAEVKGRRVLVNRGLPGERVVALVDQRRKPWQGMAKQIVQPSEGRTSPPCPYYLQACGGCQWQHLDYPSQLRAKEQMMNREMFNAGVKNEVERMHGMTNPWRYRRTAAVAIGWEAGFRPKGRRGIVELHDCLISHPLIGMFCHHLNALLREGQIPNYHGKVWLECTVVGPNKEPSLQVLIEGIKGLTLETYPELPEVAAVLAQIDGVISVAYRHRSGEAQALIGELMSSTEVDSRYLYLAAGSFSQANMEMLNKALGRMRELLGKGQARSAADVYGGVGVLGLSLLAQIGALTLIELDSGAVEAAKKTAKEWGAWNVDFISGHAEVVLAALPRQDLLILDPPRSGLGHVITATIANNPPLQILYLSCSPPSMAADLAALQETGYRIRSLEMFDFYPHTYHAEGLAFLERCA